MMHWSPDPLVFLYSCDVMVCEWLLAPLQVSQGMVGQLAARRAAGIVLEMVKVCWGRRPRGMPVCVK